MQTKDDRPRPGVLEYPDSDSHQTMLNSLNFRTLHPDLTQTPRSLSCSCGRELIVGEDWYTEIYDGTLMCWLCSCCSRCGLDGSISNRRLVSIGGYVLCYRCVKFYGESKKDAARVTVVSNVKSAKLARRQARKAAQNQQTDSGITDAHNSFLPNWWQSERSPESRRLIRYRAYPRPEAYIVALDPKVKPQFYYTATQPLFSRMACPSCKTKAQGKSSYVVPSISMVYHRSCFRCAACKTIMSNGILMAGRHFVFCTCNPPLPWCTRQSCSHKRIEHHVALKCQLEPVHPGGRPQMDTRLVINGKLVDEADEAGWTDAGEEGGADLEGDGGSRPMSPSMQPLLAQTPGQGPPTISAYYAAPPLNKQQQQQPQQSQQQAFKQHNAPLPMKLTKDGKLEPNWVKK